MLNKALILVVGLGTSSAAFAAETPIVGTVQAKCSIYTDTQGVYGNPAPNELSTTAADGGVQPVVRYDISAADYFYGRISYPTAFSSSPTLTDAVNWTGGVTVQEVSDPLMSDYDTDKTTFDNVHQYDLTVSGSTWFTVSSNVLYGSNKAFPAGEYRAIVTAECIAK
jgi:hypothetical protein